MNEPPSTTPPSSGDASGDGPGSSVPGAPSHYGGGSGLESATGAAPADAASTPGPSVDAPATSAIPFTPVAETDASSSSTPAPAEASAAHHGRRGHITHIDVDAPIVDLTVEPDVTDVLVIVHHAGGVVGQRWLRPGAGGVLRAEELRSTAGAFYGAIAHRRTRRRVLQALGQPAGEAPPMTLAVVVCTKDRPDQLRRCVESLLALERTVDILVVDNRSSTDETADVCRELGVRCVREDIPGQTAARNRGIRETDAELIAFTDDDVTVSPDWLNRIEEPFTDPLVMVATGYIGPAELVHDAQVQFEAHGGFERHPDRIVFDGVYEGPLRGASLAGAGANMVLRRTVVGHVGGFDEQLGAGTPTRTADDKVYFYRVLEAGFRIAYDPERKVWHQHRADHTALHRILRDYGTGEIVWTGHVLRSRGETGVRAMWSWWARHLVGDVRRHRRGGADGVDLELTRQELMGMIEGVQAVRRLPRVKQAGGDLVATPGALLAGPRAATSPESSAAASPTASVELERAPASVIIGSHQRRADLERTLRAVGRLDTPAERFEVVVVLDGCTDGSAEMARAMALPCEIRVVEQEHSGVARARNRALEESRNPLLAILDDDIEPSPGWLDAMVEAHAQAGPTARVFGNHPPTGGTDFAGQMTRAWWGEHLRRKAQPGHRWTMIDMVDGNSAVAAAWLRELGGWDESFRRRREDYELGWRHLQAGGESVFCAEARALHHSTLTAHSILRAARSEAADDVRLAQTHPACAHELPLASPAMRRSPGPKGRALMAVSPEAGARILGGLERAGRRGRWLQALGRLWSAGYRSGLREGLEELGLTQLPPLTDRRRVPVRIDADAPAELPALIGDVDLVFTDAGGPLASVPAVQPSAQWDWADLGDRAARALTPALSLGLAGGGGSGA